MAALALLILTLPSNETLIALVGAAGGGGLVKVAERYFRYREKSKDMATEMRNELHERVNELSEQLEKKQVEVDDWRGKYYALMERHLSNNPHATD